MAAKAWQTWGIGLIVVTITAFAPPLGILVVPLFNKTAYERIMSTLVAVGIGALSGSVLYIMVPQAMNVADNPEYIAKSSIILGAIYSFFLIDRLIQYGMEFRKIYRKRQIHQSTLLALTNPNSNAELCNGNVKPSATAISIVCQDECGETLKNELDYIAVSLRRQVPILRTSRKRSSCVDSMRSRSTTMTSKVITFDELSLQFKNNIYMTGDRGRMFKIGQTEVKKPESDRYDDMVSIAVSVVEQIVRPADLEISTFVYMIIFGSSSNNFVDGMSNGVAFSSSLVRGLSVGTACITQQIPQELGMLAILSQSGLGVKGAILVNMIPNFLSYLGFFIGAILQTSADNAAQYVFAVSSGMYLYILLGCLVPEVREATDELIKKDMRESLLISGLQFVGAAFGVLFMYGMARLQLSSDL